MQHVGENLAWFQSHHVRHVLFQTRMLDAYCSKKQSSSKSKLQGLHLSLLSRARANTYSLCKVVWWL